jgi:nucleotide-binding universal stress UspA family protein
MYQKILVPLDGSEFAECALDHVRTIAGGCQVQTVVLLQVIEPLTIFPNVDKVVANKYRETEEKFRISVWDYMGRIADSLQQSNLEVETAVVDIDHGDIAGEILNYAEENKIDLLVMSTHGRSGVSRWSAGSVTDRVTRHSVVPVLVVVPRGCRIQP